MHSKKKVFFQFNSNFQSSWSQGKLGKALGSFGGSLGVGWDSAQQAGVYWTITTDPLSLVKTAGKH